MSVLLDGLSVLGDNWQAITGLFVFIVVGSIVTGLTIRSIFRNRLTVSEYISLGVGGWLLPVSLLSLLWILFGKHQALQSGILFGLLALAVFALSIFRFASDLKPDSTSTTLTLVLFMLASIFLRLAFVFRVILPSYFDSAQHYLYIRNILEGNKTGILDLARYYHLGFHTLTAFLICALHIEIAKTMLILGQLILAMMPMSIFFLVRHETKSNTAGIFAMIVSGYGWYMPAHAVDWGKYPALMSMGIIPFVLSLAYLGLKYKDVLSTSKRWALYGTFGLSLLVSIFAHSRTLVVFGIVVLAWMTATGWQKLPRRYRIPVFVVIIIMLVSGFVFVQGQDILRLLFDPYINKGIWITALIVLFSIFALKAYPKLTFTCILVMGFLVAALFFPVKGLIPGYGNLTLLDRPYVEMILYLPLSLLGGLGLAGLMQILQNSKFKFVSLYQYVGLLIIGTTLIYSLARYDFNPSDCCIIVGSDDVVAMDWMDVHLPMSARIGIASTELKVMVTETNEGDVGSDAGIWISPLIHRVTIVLPHDSDFGQQAVLVALCQERIGYLYVGELGQTFDEAKLSSHPEWYESLLSMPKVKVYQVIGCE